MMSSKFGEVLRELRRKKRKTLAEVAQAMGWSVVYLSDIERGKRNPPRIRDIKKLAKILDVDPGILLEAAAESERPVAVNELPPNAREVALALMRKSFDLSEEQKRMILEILNGRVANGRTS